MYYLAVACETMTLAYELHSHLVDKRKKSAADGKTKSRDIWIGLGQVHSIMF